MKKAVALMCLFVLMSATGCGCRVQKWPAAEKINPLTGLPIAEDNAGTRPFAVDIGNSADAMPQHGVSRADIVYEMEVEYGITRLMCLFSDVTDIDFIGPLRSLRDYFLGMTYPFDPIYAGIGYSIPSGAAIERYNLDYLDGDVFNGMVFLDAERMEQGYASWNCRMTSGAHLAAACMAGEKRTETEEGMAPAFNFGDSQPLPGGEAAQIGFYFNAPQGIEDEDYDGTFRYNPETGRYLKYQHGDPQTDGGDGVQLAFDNVFVLFGDIAGLDGGASRLVRFDFEAGGTGFYFYGGRYTEIRWTKGSFEDNFAFYDAATGEELVVGRGQSYIGVVNKNKADLLEIE